MSAINHVYPLFDRLPFDLSVLVGEYSGDPGIYEQWMNNPKISQIQQKNLTSAFLQAMHDHTPADLIRTLQEAIQKDAHHVVSVILNDRDCINRIAQEHIKKNTICPIFVQATAHPESLYKLFKSLFRYLLPGDRFYVLVQVDNETFKKIPEFVSEFFQESVTLVEIFITKVASTNPEKLQLLLQLPKCQSFIRNRGDKLAVHKT